MPEQKFDVFLSYNSADRAAVEDVARRLTDRSVNVWLDRWNLVPGQAWQEQLGSDLDSSRAVAVFIGPTGLGPWEQTEYRSYLAHLFEDSTFRIIPVLLPGAHEANIPLFLRRFTCLDLRDQSPANVQHVLDRIGATLPPEDTAKPSSPRIFLCHAQEDGSRVEELYFALGKAGFDPWYDKKNLLIGVHWKKEIKLAIEQADYFAICLSQRSSTKRGFVQKEIRIAVHEYQRRPPNSIFLLPIRLEECIIPDIDLDDTTVLRDLHWFDVFEDDQMAIQELTDAVWKQWRKSRSE